MRDDTVRRFIYVIPKQDVGKIKGPNSTPLYLMSNLVPNVDGGGGSRARRDIVGEDLIMFFFLFF